MKTGKSQLLRYVFVLFIFQLISFQGCLIGDGVSIPIKVEHLPNSFKPNIKCLGEKVSTIEVWKHYEPSSNELVWQVNAVDDVPAKGFIVTVGKIPKGFQQVIPSPPDEFYPMPGQEYAIVILTNCIGVHAISNFWIAE